MPMPPIEGWVPGDNYGNGCGVWWEWDPKPFDSDGWFHKTAEETTIEKYAKARKWLRLPPLVCFCTKCIDAEGDYYKLMRDYARC
jgi:hypothetical protein